MIWTVLGFELTPTLSLNEAVRLAAGAVGILLHLWLIAQAVDRHWALKRAGLNGGLLYVAWSRIENEAICIVLQALMFAPALMVMTTPPTVTAQTQLGIAVVWMQAAVSVILTLWAWRRYQRGAKLDEILAEKE